MFNIEVYEDVKLIDHLPAINLFILKYYGIDLSHLPGSKDPYLINYSISHKVDLSTYEDDILEYFDNNIYAYKIKSIIENNGYVDEYYITDYLEENITSYEFREILEENGYIEEDDCDCHEEKEDSVFNEFNKQSLYFQEPKNMQDYLRLRDLLKENNFLK